MFDTRNPSTWRTNADGSLVCPHRDLSVCAECARHPEVIEVYGAHYWDPDESFDTERSRQAMARLYADGIFKPAEDH